jgi:hypothetical protein
MAAAWVNRCGATGLTTRYNVYSRIPADSQSLNGNRA